MTRCFFSRCCGKRLRNCTRNRRVNTVTAARRFGGSWKPWIEGFSQKKIPAVRRRGRDGGSEKGGCWQEKSSQGKRQKTRKEKRGSRSGTRPEARGGDHIRA